MQAILELCKEKHIFPSSNWHTQNVQCLGAEENYIQPEGTPNAQHIHVFDSTEIAALAHYVTKCFSKQELLGTKKRVTK